MDCSDRVRRTLSGFGRGKDRGTGCCERNLTGAAKMEVGEPGGFGGFRLRRGRPRLRRGFSTSMSSSKRWVTVVIAVERVMERRCERSELTILQGQGGRYRWATICDG